MEPKTTRQKGKGKRSPLSQRRPEDIIPERDYPGWQMVEGRPVEDPVEDEELDEYQRQLGENDIQPS